MSVLQTIDRDVRQRDLVPPARLAACHALVIGVGAIGRQVALQLAALGVANMTLCDDDRVAVENLAPQGYWPQDLGAFKVDTTGKLCHSINPTTQVRTFSERFRRSTVKDLSGGCRLLVFCCVDSIGTRRLIWEALRHQAAIFIDGRMSAEVLRVLTAESPATDDTYAGTLFSPEQSYSGACTARSTIYAGAIAAGIMVGQMTKWLRNLPVEHDITLNLLSMELALSPEGRV